jgi:hypothetical protein
VLGRSLTSEEGTIKSFDGFSEQDLNDIQTLKINNSVYAISYIRFKLKGNISLRLALSYYSMVIQEGLSVEKWVILENP